MRPARLDTDRAAHFLGKSTTGLALFVALFMLEACAAQKDAMAPVAPSADMARGRHAEADAPAPAAPAPQAPAAMAGGAAQETQTRPPGPSTAGAQKSAPPAQKDGRTNAKSAPSATSAPAITTMIIYTGELRMQADEPKLPQTLDRIVDVAEALGGHLAGRTNDTVVVKVPSASFREAMTKMEPFGWVTHRSVTADDVTEQFHDAEVRLTNLKATRQRLQEFLARASTIQDTLTVERELERVAQEIDVLEGRLRFLRDRATWSQISVHVSPKPKDVAPVVVAAPPKEPPPPARIIDLPVPWLAEVGASRLLDLK